MFDLIEFSTQFHLQKEEQDFKIHFGSQKNAKRKVFVGLFFSDEDE